MFKKILKNHRIIFMFMRVILLFRKNTSCNVKDTSVLIAAPGGGNIGDQAMLESFLENVDGKKIVISINDNALEIPNVFLDETRIIVLPGLIYGWLLIFLRDFTSFLGVLKSAKIVYLVGADVMDGGYNKNASALRSYIAIAAARCDNHVRILGFSWKDDADREAAYALKLAGEEGVELLARDPLSYARLVDYGMENVTQVADVVFSSSSVKDEGIQDILDFCKGKKIALVNVSGLISQNVDQVKEYLAIISKLHIDNYRVVLLPHVIRDGANDLDSCREVSMNFDNLFFVDRLLEPMQVKRIVQEASIVITGRMHLSIMSLNAGVPSIVLSTQGKVDGLMLSLGVPEFSVEPCHGFSTNVINLIDFVAKDEGAYRKKILKNLSPVRRLSNDNFK